MPIPEGSLQAKTIAGAKLVCIHRQLMSYPSKAKPTTRKFALKILSQAQGGSGDRRLLPSECYKAVFRAATRDEAVSWMDAVKRGLPKDMVEGDGEEAASLLPAARLRDLLGPEVELLAPRVRKEWDAAGPKLGQVVGVLPSEKKNTPRVCWWQEGEGQNAVRRERQFANERLLDRFVQRDPYIRISSSVLLRPDDYVILSRPVDARNLI